jgi:hypothetical protein
MAAASITTATAPHERLVARGLQLEALTIGWNVLGRALKSWPAQQREVPVQRCGATRVAFQARRDVRRFEGPRDRHGIRS